MNMLAHNFRNSANLIGAIVGGLIISVPVIPQIASAQQTTPKVNPCPSIFYEEPHNNQVLVPQGCPPNAFTQRQAAQGLLPNYSTPGTPSAAQTQLGVGGEAPGATSSTLNPNPSILNEAPYNRTRPTSQPEGVTQTSETTQPSVTTPSQTPRQQTQTPTTGQTQAPVATIALTSGRVNIRLVNDTAANVTYQVIGDTAPRSLQGKSNVTLQGLNAPVTVTFQREDGGLLNVTPLSSSRSGVLELRFKETTDVGQDRSALRIENNGSVFLN